MEGEKGKICPSAQCEEGAQLIGIVQEGGTVGFIRPEIPVTPDFVSAVAGAHPEKRFRFASPCMQEKCLNWQRNRCAVADHLAAHAPDEAAGDLPFCAVRASCQWFAQVGEAACGVCPFVVTDHTPLEDT